MQHGSEDRQLVYDRYLGIAGRIGIVPGKSRCQPAPRRATGRPRHRKGFKGVRLGVRAAWAPSSWLLQVGIPSPPHLVRLQVEVGGGLVPLWCNCR